MHEKSIELLNKAVADEMAAVNQYMYFHIHCEDQGYELLSKLFFKIAVQEMGHIEHCAERVLFLGGDVEMVAAEPVQKIRAVKAMLERARDMEQGSARDYNLWANESSANADAATRKIFEGLVADEEGHFAIFDIEVQNLEKYGDQYLALQSIEASKKAVAGG